MAGRVFLCHSSGDKEQAQDLYRRLQQDGYQPWLDEEDLLPGQDWEGEIRHAIRESRHVLVCLSKNSVNKRGYVQKEIKHALDVADEQPEGSIFLIPARLEECKVPDRLRGRHWVDLFAAGGYERLLRTLGRDTDTQSASPPIPPRILPPIPSSPPPAGETAFPGPPPPNPTDAPGRDPPTAPYRTAGRPHRIIWRLRRHGRAATVALLVTAAGAALTIIFAPRGDPTTVSTTSASPSPTRTPTPPPPASPSPTPTPALLPPSTPLHENTAPRSDGAQQRLTSGQSITSPDGEYRLSLQPTGALILSNGHSLEFWYTDTAGYSGAYLELTRIGRLVLFNRQNEVIWDAGKNAGPGASFRVQNDGNFVLRDADERTVWATGTPRSTLKIDERLEQGYALVSDNGLYAASMQYDGNFVVHDATGKEILESRTKGGPGTFILLQGDHNLVIYDSGNPIWFSDTGFTGLSSLVIQDNGHLLMRDEHGNILDLRGRGWGPGGVAQPLA